MKPAYLRANAHTHSQFCDGKCTAEQMAQAAFEKGFHTLGFSSHSALPNESWALQDQQAYRAEIQRLKQEYVGRMAVVYGLEWDLDSDPVDREGCEYIIGSVHRIKGPVSGLTFEVDHTLEEMQICRDHEFEGDGIAMVGAYFDRVEQMIDQKPDILGHMDLIRKHNSKNVLFPEDAPEIVNRSLEVLEKAARAGILVELNTGGNYRGYRTDFYPAERLLAEFARMGGRMTLSSDSHNAESLGWKFEEAAKKAKRAGFRTLWVLTGNGFKEIEIQ